MSTDERWAPLLGDGQPRVEPVMLDLKSLSDSREQLSGKVQFLLDATLGFINIAQNDIVQTLTVASAAGIPPVLVEGIYGMNFQHMPELSWKLGYPMALALIVVTAIIPGCGLSREAGCEPGRYGHFVSPRSSHCSHFLSFVSN